MQTVSMQNDDCTMCYLSSTSPMSVISDMSAMTTSTSSIMSTVSTMNTVSTNSTTSLMEAPSNTLAALTWVDFVGFGLQGCVITVGSAINSFVIWVLAHQQQKTPMDVIHLNMAFGNLLDGLIGSAFFLLARVFALLHGNGLKYFFISVTLNVSKITFENMNIMFMLLLRTVQVRCSSCIHNLFRTNSLHHALKYGHDFSRCLDG